MSLVKNPDRISQGIDLWMTKVRKQSVEQYRDFVWEVFKRVLRESPQYSGKAVANWRLSVGAPDEGFDASLGDPEEVDVVQSEDGRYHSKVVPTREKGDEKWERYARDRARKVMKTIGYKDTVFISNNALGDDGLLYMAELQNAEYWANHLRMANQPYETVRESIIAETVKSLRRRNNPSPAARIGGDTWNAT